MATLKVEKTPNHISEYADTSFSYAFGDDKNCTINFMKYAPELMVSDNSLIINQEVIIHPEVFATICLSREHAITLAHTILRTIGEADS